MKAKSKFYVLIVIYQIFLIMIILSSINGLVNYAAAQGDGSGTSDPATISAFAYATAIAVSAGVLSSAIALRSVGTAAISSLVEREDTYAKAFIIVALCEALAVYGLIIAILLYTKIP